MTKNLFSVSLDHSKLHFCDLWMILRDLVMLSNIRKHLVLSQYAISSRSNRPNSKKWPKTSFLAVWIIQKCIFVIFEWSCMTCHHGKMFKNIFHYHHLQYQTIQTSQAGSNGQNAHIWPFGSFKNAFLWSLNDFTWPGNIVEGWQTFSTITICNIKSI